MGGADTLFGAILQNFMELMPFVVIRTFEAGIRWRFGRKPRALDAGFWWRVPLYHQIEKCNIVDEALELPPQTVMTKDSHAVTFTTNIAYRIVDILAHWTVEDFEISTKALAMTHLAQSIRSKTLAELDSDGIAKLEKQLEGRLTTRLKDWGAQVFSVGLTNFTETPSATRLFLEIPSTFALSQNREH